MLFRSPKFKPGIPIREYFSAGEYRRRKHRKNLYHRLAPNGSGTFMAIVPSMCGSSSVFGSPSGIVKVSINVYCNNGTVVQAADSVNGNDMKNA